MNDEIELESIVREILGRMAVLTGTKSQIKLRRVRAYILEMEDVLFHHNSAVMMPSAPEGKSSTDGVGDNPEDADIQAQQSAISGLPVLAVAFKQFEFDDDLRLVVAGHADTSGDFKYNFDISALRAQNVLYLLEEGKADDWAQICYDRHKIEDYQQIMKYFHVLHPDWDCDPFKVDDKWGDWTEGASKNFFAAVGLPESTLGEVKRDGRKRWPVSAWRAVYDLYIGEICRALKISDETALNERYRSLLRFVDDTKKFVGCGESFPIDQSERNNYRSQENRRVELFFFRRDEAPEVMDCPARTSSAHTTEECPLRNRHHITPFYIDPADLTAIAYHLQFVYVDPILGSRESVPEGFTLGAFETVGGVVSEVQSNTTYSNGTYIVRVQDNPNRQSIHFEFQFDETTWIFTENDSATPKIMAKPYDEVAALAWGERKCYYDLPLKWSSRNWWTRNQADNTTGHRFAAHLQAGTIKPYGNNMTSRDHPLIFSLDDLVLVTTAGSQAIRDKNDSDAAINLSADSRLTMLFLDSSDGYKMTIFNRRSTHPYFSNVDFSQNLIVFVPMMLRLVIFANDFYSVTDKRTTEAMGVDFSRNQLLGARAAVLSDAAHHKGEPVHVDPTSGASNDDYTYDGCGNYELHYLDACGELDGKPLSYLIVYWHCRLRLHPTKPATDANWRTNWEKEGIINAIERTNRPYLLEKLTGSKDILIKTFVFYEAKLDGRGGAHKCLVDISDEDEAWMLPTTSKMCQTQYKPLPGYYSDGGDTLQDVDGKTYAPLTCHHEMGHATGLLDDYVYSISSPESYPGIPDMEQPHTAPGGPYRYDRLARMFHNRVPRMLEVWHFVNWLNDRAGSLLNSFLDGTQFKLTYPYSGASGSGKLELDLTKTNYRNFGKPSFSGLDQVLGATGKADLLLYKIGGETSRTMVAGKVYDGILTCRVNIDLDFNNTVGRVLSGNRWTRAERQSWIEQALLVPIASLNKKFDLVSTGANDFARTLLIFSLFFRISGTATTLAPHFEIEITNDDSADFDGDEEEIEVGNNVDGARILRYMFGKTAASPFVKGDFAGIAAWVGRADVANGTFTVEDR